MLKALSHYGPPSSPLCWAAQRGPVGRAPGPAPIGAYGTWGTGSLLYQAYAAGGGTKARPPCCSYPSYATYDTYLLTYIHTYIPTHTPIYLYVSYLSLSLALYFFRSLSLPLALSLALSRSLSLSLALYLISILSLWGWGVGGGPLSLVHLLQTWL